MSSVASHATPLPPLRLYPEREVRVEKGLDRAAAVVSSAVAARLAPFFQRRLPVIARKVSQYSNSLEALGDQELRGFAAQVRTELVQHRFKEAVVAKAFALVREVATRTIGQRHYDVQLIGGFALLKGMIAEMETGEGKTLTATLPACAAALAGLPVHVVTVNDYLVRRDAELMGPIYRWLGLTVGTIVHGMAPAQRRGAYQSDITYCSNKELAFDYLRDRLALGDRVNNIQLKFEMLCGENARVNHVVMRGLKFAIVDEADSVLIDEARTPLIISGETDPGEEQRTAEDALNLIKQLKMDHDYVIYDDDFEIQLTERGCRALLERAAELDLEWMGSVRREALARQALAAIHLFHKDEHYIVRDDQVQIVDEYTGRLMADRSWSEGLHQIIEEKEGCKVTGRKVPLARMTYQRFFRRYEHLSGMTGTARETASELLSVYGLPVVRIPTNRPLRRKKLRNQICRNVDDKWRHIAQRVAQLQEMGRPVLVGTRSVAASQEASEQLSALGIPHVVLNAAQDKDEAEIIAAAGQRGQVTIATNMAGRGVDIELGQGVHALGGLHIIMSERHDAGRIDRQLIGRCGRHGEPGSSEAALSLEDPLLEKFGSWVLQRMARLPGQLGFAFARLAFDRAQLKAERLHSKARRELIRYDQRLDTLFSFAGRSE